MGSKQAKQLPAFRVRDLLSPKASSLKIRLIAGKRGLDRPVETSRVERAWRAFSNRTDSISPGSVQLVGSKELEGLAALPSDERKRVLRNLGELPVAALLLPQDLVAPSYLKLMARQNRLPLLVTPLDAPVAARRIGRFIEKMMGRSEIVHGVLMDIYGLGTLIVGESGIGKSESALELIERGHRLVSDDIIEFYRNSSEDTPGPQGWILMGRSPSLTRYFMEIRGLGIINVKDLFGPNSICTTKSVDLVIRLERWEKATEIERLGLEEETYAMLGSLLPLVRMPVGPGRNLAMLIEVAARNHLLKLAGRHPARRLMKRVSATGRPASGGSQD